MALHKPPLPEHDEGLQDLPPSYDALSDIPPPLPRDEKVERPMGSPSASSTHGPRHLSRRSSLALSSEKSGGRRSPRPWFALSAGARPNEEARATIQDLLSDLMKETDAQGALGPDQPDVVAALLAHAAPLSDATVDEVRLACLHTSNHGLFQRLRRSPAFAPLSGSDEGILGSNLPADDIEVEGVPGDEDSFVERRYVLQFIAKESKWHLGCEPMCAGTWAVVLFLLAHSPPTSIDSRLVIEDPRVRTRTRPPPLSGPPESSQKAVENVVQRVQARERAGGSPSEPKPSIELRIKHREALTAYVSHRGLAGGPLGRTLQFEGCPYIDSDGTLVARLEARLLPPGPECVVC
ncbi:hypothetical protein OH77DRAFT_1494432 [Trametes cingulata]|nr:hypothetical protein OH77DRAFT_1494432 [Trametes cingulata]